jgi:hypothetical protein
MSIENERHYILQMVENGKITPEQGLQLLQALQTSALQNIEEDAATHENLFPDDIEAEESPMPGTFTGEPATDPDNISEAGQYIPPDSDSSSADGSQAIPGSIPEDAKKWRRFWMVPLWVGVGFIVFGALLMLWAQQASGIGFWFFCAGVPFMLGLFVVVLAWQSRTSPWLHLRVQQPPGEWPRRIAISFPLPLRPTAWFIRTFRPVIPGMENLALDEVILALQDSTSSESPLFIEVEDDEDGERVEIYIG